MVMRKAVLGSASKDQAVHRISALLHTTRCIAQHEDQLCTLLHATENSKGLTAGLQAELRALLDTMPSHEYTDEMEAVRQTLTLAPTAPKRKPITAKKSVARRARARVVKNPKRSAARKTTGQKRIGRREL